VAPFLSSPLQIFFVFFERHRRTSVAGKWQGREAAKGLALAISRAGGKLAPSKKAKNRIGFA